MLVRSLSAPAFHTGRYLCAQLLFVPGKPGTDYGCSVRDAPAAAARSRAKSLLFRGLRLHQRIYCFTYSTSLLCWFSLWDAEKSAHLNTHEQSGT